MKNKKIIVMLSDKDLDTYKFLKQDIRYTLQSFQEALKRDDPLILTTCLEAISSEYYFMYDYEIEVMSEGIVMNFTDVLKGKETDREIRQGHDWRKLVLNGEFDKIKTVW